jgi:hypothetical protein
MKKTIILTESQLKMLQEQEWEMSSVDNAKLVEKAQKDLAIIHKSFDSHYNMIVSVTMSDIINDMRQYTDTLENLDTIIESVEKKYNYYFDIVESHDLFDRPNEISTLSDLTFDMYAALEDLKDIKYVLDDMLDLTRKLSDKKPKNVIKLNENKKKII